MRPPRDGGTRGSREAAAEEGGCRCAIIACAGRCGCCWCCCCCLEEVDEETEGDGGCCWSCCWPWADARPLLPPSADPRRRSMVAARRLLGPIDRSID